MSSPSVTSRPAAVAGLFYPASAAALRAEVREHLDGVASGDASDPKVLVVPHAGYVYSGPTAARAYAALRGRAAPVRRVVLIGPAHRVAVRGVAVPSVDRFETPLGKVPLDRGTLDALAASPHVVVSDRAHAAEHSLEVQLPFLQETLGAFTLVPLLAGDAADDAVAEVLDRVWGGSETLIVVSTDLSHYLPYDSARRIDADTLEQVLHNGPGLDHGQACGATPLNALMQLARRRGLRPRLLAACNSGDTAGDRDRVVGYAALSYATASPAASAGSDDRGAILLAHARHAVESLFGCDGRDALPDAPFLDAPGATFVTLHRHGELRGCVGMLEADRSLRDDVARNARSAALRDPRFEPLRAEELDGLTIEVSLLAPPRPLVFSDEDDLLRQLGAERAGVIVEHGRRRATFLPQVWEQLPDAREFLAHLKAKAGLAAEVDATSLSVSTYAVEKWSER